MNMRRAEYIDQQLAKLATIRHRYDIINPLNKKEEFEKFLAAKGEYNPQFIYKSINVKTIIKQLEALEIAPKNPLYKTFAHIRDDLLEEAKALANIGSDSFLVQRVFGTLDKKELTLIKQILAKKPPSKQEETKEETIYPSQVLKERIKTTLEKYNLTDWTIIHSKHALSRISITNKSKTITIKADETFTAKDMQKIIVHEIETHLLRWRNGETQPYNIFKIGTREYLATEEGLAGYNEITQQVAGNNAQYMQAVLAYATHLGATKGFVEIYKKIRPFIEDEESAFRIVTRVKRGLGDTSRPGGYLKDHAYFQGRLRIEKFIKHKGDIKDLYAGKIGIDDLQLIQEGYLKKPTYLPEFLK